MNFTPRPVPRRDRASVPIPCTQRQQRPEFPVCLSPRRRRSDAVPAARHRWRACSSARNLVHRDLVSPAERIDVLVDFAGIARRRLRPARKSAFDPMHRIPADACRSGVAPRRETHDMRVPAKSRQQASRTCRRRRRGCNCCSFEFAPRGAAAPAASRAASRRATPLAAADERPLRLGFARNAGGSTTACTR